MAYKKRYYNKRRKNTKKFNKYAYAKTDSRNQAKQIVRLNKKINKVYNNTRPEIKRYNHTEEITLHGGLFEAILPTALFGGTAISSIFQGNYGKYVYFNFRIYFNPTSLDMTKGKSLRIVILQNKYPLNELPALADLFNDAEGTFGIFSPFKDNIKNKFRILLSKSYIVSSDKDMLYRAYNFKKLLAYKKTTGDTATYPRGTIFMFFKSPTGQEDIKIYYSSKVGIVDN